MSLNVLAMTVQVSAEWHALMFAAPLQQWLVGALAAHASAAAWAATATPTTQGPSPHAPKHDKERGLLGEVLRHMLVQLCQVQRANKGDYKEVVEIGLHGFMAVRPFKNSDHHMSCAYR